MIRRCAYARHGNPLIHLFHEGAHFSLCGRMLSLEYHVRPDHHEVTCIECRAALARETERRQLQEAVA